MTNKRLFVLLDTGCGDILKSLKMFTDRHTDRQTDDGSTGLL